jgi:hypothetical protein
MESRASRRNPGAHNRFLVAPAGPKTVDAFHGHSSLPSPAHQSLVHRDLDQPGAEASLGAELPDVGKRLQHRLLRRVLGILLIAQDGKRRGIHPPLIGPNQFIEQFMLPALHAQNKILLARAMPACPGLFNEAIFASDIWLRILTRFWKGSFGLRP